jgi:hypothetical protein
MSPYNNLYWTSASFKISIGSICAKKKEKKKSASFEDSSESFDDDDNDNDDDDDNDDNDDKYVHFVYMLNTTTHTYIYIFSASQYWLQLMKVPCSSSSLSSFVVLTYVLGNSLSFTSFIVSSTFNDNDGI